MKFVQLGILLLIALFGNCVAEDAGPFRGIASLAGDVAAVALRQLRSESYSGPILNQPELLIAEPFGISRLNLTSSSRRTILRTQFIGGIDYHFGQDRMFWSDLATGRIYSRPLNAHSRATYKVQLFAEYSPLAWRPKALAVDHVSDKLYVLDARGRKIHVFEIGGQRRHGVIFDGFLDEPMDIAVDPQEGVMFIADGRRIIKVNMDGTSPTAIVGHKRYYIKSVTLDTANKRVYWSDEAYHRIKSAKYDGTDLAVVLKNEFGKSYQLLGPANLAFHADQLYFYDDVFRRVSRVEVDGPAGYANETSFRTIYSLIYVKAMRLIHPARQPRLANPCLHEDQRICVLGAKNVTSGSLSCTCL